MKDEVCFIPTAGRFESPCAFRQTSNFSLHTSTDPRIPLHGHAFNSRDFFLLRYPPIDAIQEAEVLLILRRDPPSFVVFAA